MATLDVGKIKFTWKGAYSSSTAYVVDDVVSHTSSSWVCVQNGTGQTPADGSSYWQVMAEGIDTLTTRGDLLTRSASANTRLAKGTAGQIIKAGANDLEWSASSGYEGFTPLGTNVPLYADSDDGTTYGEGGKYPWFADYGNSWVPYDGMPNGACGPVKRDRNSQHADSVGIGFWYLNTNHEPVFRGYDTYRAHGSNAAEDNGAAVINANISTEFGGLRSGDYPVRIWYNDGNAWFLTNEGDLFVRGENQYGQLGLGDTTDRWLWVRNPYLGPDATVSSTACTVSAFTVSLGYGYTGIPFMTCFAIDSSKRVHSWGYNAQGQAGVGSTSNVTTPTHLSGISNTVQISAGVRDVYFVDTSGNMTYTGNNTSGLGEGSTRTAPTAVSGVSGVSQVLCASGTYSSTYSAVAYALKTDGDLYAIGENSAGQLGDGSTTDRTAWVDVGGSNTFSAVHQTGQGAYHAGCAIGGTPGNGNSTIYLTGYNGGGVLMQGNTTNLSAWTQPGTGVFGTDIAVSVTSANGSLSKTELTFPRTTISAVFPARFISTNNAFFFVDTLGRLWTSGYHLNTNDHQVDIAATSFTNAFPMPVSWSHSRGSGTSYIGKTESTIDDIINFGDIDSGGLPMTILKASDGKMFFLGDNTNSQMGFSTTTDRVQFVAMHPGS